MFKEGKLDVFDVYLPGTRIHFFEKHSNYENEQNVAFLAPQAGPNVFYFGTGRVGYLKKKVGYWDG